MGARGGGAVAGAVVSAAGDHRRKPIPAFQGVIRAVIWPWSTVVACVIHWWLMHEDWGLVGARDDARRR